MHLAFQIFNKKDLYSLRKHSFGIKLRVQCTVEKHMTKQFINPHSFNIPTRSAFGVLRHMLRQKVYAIPVGKEPRKCSYYTIDG